MVMIGSREAKEDVEERSAERGRNDGRKKGRWGKCTSKGTVSIAEVELTIMGLQVCGIYGGCGHRIMVGDDW